MGNIREHLKAAGIVNTVLIADVFLCQIVRLCMPIGLLEKFKSLCFMVTLIFGLFYAFNGYKKNAAKYYKTYMICYAVSVLAAVVNSVSKGSGHMIEICISLFTLCAALMLAFAKDLGRDRSKFAGYFILVLSIVNIIIVAIDIGGLPAIIGAIEEAALAALTCIFVAAKYADKNKRGTI